MGCGRVGATLARSLSDLGHDVAVIDMDPTSFRRLGSSFEGRTITGMGFDRGVLVAAGIREAYAFAAVSSGDNSNILAARVVRETFEVHNVVARIYDQGRAEVYERLGIPSVATVRWASDQVLRRLLPSGSEPQWRDPSGSVRLIEVHVNSTWVGKTIADMESRSRCQIPFLMRFGSGIVPVATTVFQDGDLVYAAVTNDQVSDVEDIFGRPPVEH